MIAGEIYFLYFGFKGIIYKFLGPSWSMIGDKIWLFILI
jgi:hypothetical protein